MPSNIIRTPTVTDLCIIRIPISALKRSAYLPKTATSVRDSKLPSGSRLENGLGRWVRTRGNKNGWPLEATSLKPNCSRMHGGMALNDSTTMPCSQSLCDIQLARLPSQSITAVAAGHRRGEEGRLGQSMSRIAIELKAPSRHGAHRRPIRRSCTTSISIIGYFTVFDSDGTINRNLIDFKRNNRKFWLLPACACRPVRRPVRLRPRINRSLPASFTERRPSPRV